MAFCSNCGQKLTEGAKFCNNCGTATGGVQAKKETVVPPPPIQTPPAEETRKHQNDEPITKRQTVYDGEIHKCPHCGEVIEVFMAKCPACGFELNSKKVSSTLQKFIDEINECEKAVAGRPSAGKSGWAAWSKSKRFWWVVLNLLFVGIPLVIYLALPLVTLKTTPKLTAEEKRLASVIENFPFPNDRESILSALVFAKEKIDFVSKETINRKNAYWMRLWCAKAEQLKQKADMMFPNDTIVRDSYNEITADENRVNKVIKIKAIVGLVVLVAAIIFLVIRYGGNVGVTDKKDYDATFEWQTTGLFAELPEPDSNNGKIVMETEKQINFELYNISDDDFNAYVKKCREAGFTYEVTKNDSVFYATDEDGYDLNLFYDAKKDVLSIHISAYDLSDNSNKSNDSSDDDDSTGQSSNNDISNQLNIPDDFFEGYEKAEFSKYNSPASENGLGDNRIYFYCTLDKTEILEADGTTSILGYVTDDSGNEWLIQLHFVPAVSKTAFNSYVGKELVLRGVYSGFSGTKEMPVVVLDEMIVLDTGENVMGMQKLLDE